MCALSDSQLNSFLNMRLFYDLRFWIFILSLFFHIKVCLPLKIIQYKCYIKDLKYIWIFHYSPAEEAILILISNSNFILPLILFFTCVYTRFLLLFQKARVYLLLLQLKLPPCLQLLQLMVSFIYCAWCIGVSLQSQLIYLFDASLLSLNYWFKCCLISLFFIRTNNSLVLSLSFSNLIS